MRISGLVAVATGLLALFAGCESHAVSSTPLTNAQCCAAMPPATEPAPGQSTFASPADAVSALVAAIDAKDQQTRLQILGPVADDLASGDPVADANARKHFAAKAAEKTSVEMCGDNSAVITIGTNDYPFPIPLMKSAAGRWFFDTDAGKAQILARRIGRNELEAIEVCQTYVVAQREYASKDRDGSDVLQYAQRFKSQPGTHNGLVWDAQPGDEPSPLGPLAAEAAAEGYGDKKGPGPHPFHGYIFHILKEQGPHAPGGAYNYVINGNMIAGFALIARPAKYGNSGIMTFLISHTGKLYEKDFGPNTESVASQIAAYDPDPTWKPVK